MGRAGVAAVLLALATGIAAAACRPSTPPPEAGVSARTPDPMALRVCADPNNLPFSNDRGEGFENALADLVAADMGRTVAYTWWPQRRGFFRTTLRAGACDVVMGVPADFELALTTDPYYRSSYVFVTRPALRLSSMDDPRLRRLRIGIHLVGDDYANVPPGDALVSRGIVANVRGYSIYGDYAKPNPPADLIDAVARNEVDAAIVWGPTAGFFASRTDPPLAVSLARNDGRVPFEFSIAMGVRPDDRELRDRLNDVLARRRSDVAAILDRYHVPRADTAAPLAQAVRR